LIDVSEPDENWTLSRFQQAAQEIIIDIHQRGKFPICVGGTGQYISALTQGWVIPKIEENPILRQALNNWAEKIGKYDLFQKLKLLDPVAAEKMDPNNLRRTIRAIEVIFITGKLFSEQRKKESLPYQVYQIGLRRDRAEIFERVEKRVDMMMERGFLKEVEGLLLQGYNRKTRAFSAIGYPQLIAFLQGEISLIDALTEIKSQTKKFVRRQNTWFKPNDPEINWYEVDENTIDLVISDLVNLKVLQKP
jgi:tRNA dimethylallyltransferase